MKSVSFLVFALALTLCGPEAKAIPGIKVAGLAKVDGKYTAFFSAFPRNPKDNPILPILAEGESQEGLHFIKFDPEKGEIHISNDGKESILSWPQGDLALNFQNVALPQALDFYTRWSKRAWIWNSGVPFWPGLNIQSKSLDTPEAFAS